MGASYPGPAEALERYEALIQRVPEIVRRGAKNPYTSLNGHMFSFLDATGSMGLRLSREDREEFLVSYESRIAEQYGRNMPEYVVIPDELLANADELVPWLARSYEWVGTLTPKPTTR